MSNINWPLLIGTIGVSLKNGYSLGHALFDAAVTHENDCERFNRESDMQVKINENGNIDFVDGITLADFILARQVVRETIEIARYDVTDRFTADDEGNPIFDEERLREHPRFKDVWVREVKDDCGNTRIILEMKKQDKDAALKIFRDYLDLDEQEQQTNA